MAVNKPLAPGTLDLSIIIVTWNSKNYIGPCLESVYAHPINASFEVLLVDNDSHDDTVAFVRRQFPQVRLIANHANRGFAAANNQAICLSKGNNILLLNPDTVVYPEAVNRMLEFQRKTPDAAVVGPRLLNGSGKVMESYSLFPGPRLLFRGLCTAFSASFDKLEARPFTKPEVVDWVGGACMLIRRDVLSKVGLLDESFFIYWEEADLCWRIKERGWKTYYFPQSDVIHYQGGSIAAAAPEKLFLHGLLLEEWAASADTFLRKHYSAWIADLFTYLLVTQMLLALGFWGAVYALLPPKRSRALPVLRAYRQALANAVRRRGVPTQQVPSRK